MWKAANVEGSILWCGGHWSFNRVQFHNSLMALPLLDSVFTNGKSSQNASWKWVQTMCYLLLFTYSSHKLWSLHTTLVCCLGMKGLKGRLVRGRAGLELLPPLSHVQSLAQLLFFHTLILENELWCVSHPIPALLFSYFQPASFLNIDLSCAHLCDKTLQGEE